LGKIHKVRRRLILGFSLGLLICLLVLSSRSPALNALSADDTSTEILRRVNVPYTVLLEGIPASARAVFWFGQVNPTTNYADVRMIYNPQALYVTLHIFDRQLWYDTSPAESDLTAWDAVSLYLERANPGSSALSAASYRFIAQLNHWQPRADYQTAYRGTTTGWETADIAFSTETGWRGEAPNGPDARGWLVTFRIPYSSLGLSGPPQEGTLWKLALAVHDRDDAGGAPIELQTWPEGANSVSPETWGELRFGIPTFTPTAVAAVTQVDIRHGLNGAIVRDAPVGGHTICGQPFWPDFFSGWGDAVHQDVYTPPDQFNVQNQWDVADWPCFSKFYITFPLDRVPMDKAIVSASLTLHQFGNTLPEEAVPSQIQVLSVGEEWQEETVTWNNAPLAVENGTRTTVYPLQEAAPWPGIPYSWDVSREVVRAHEAGEPVRLVLYSADGPYHTGKYFSSSETGDWNEIARPTLTVRYGTAVELDHAAYLPHMVRAP
jgi:hypothetical protein